MKAIEFTWNENLDMAKEQGVVLVLAENFDGTKGVGYAIWNGEIDDFVSAVTLEKMNAKVIAWAKDTQLIPSV